MKSVIVRLVVDASVAVKWVAPEEQQDAAEAILVDAIERIAPEFMLIETANVLRNKVMRGQISSDQARTGLDLVAAAVGRFIADHELVARAFDIAAQINHSVYDCLYLACAERQDAQLITADRRLALKVEKTAVGSLIQVLPS